MITLLPVRGLPEVRPGDDLAALVADAAVLRDGDVVVVSQKIVSKAEGALVAPRPGESRDAARRRVATEQAVRVVADTPQALIVQTRHGFVCANAGVDASNVPGGLLALLPDDPDASASRLRAALRQRTGRDVGVVVADTFGRPWRLGQTDVAIGVAGLAPLRDERGGRDRGGLPLQVTEVAVADEVAAAADLVRRKNDGVPVVIVRGLDWTPDEAAAAQVLVRPAHEDLFPRGRGMLAETLAGPGQGDPVARAATRAGAGLVDVAATVDGLLIRPRSRAAADLVAAGAAAAAAVAALADLGRHAAHRLEEHEAGVTVRVVVGPQGSATSA